MIKKQLAGAVQSKSVWFGAALVGLGALQTNMNLLSSVLTAEQFGVATSIVGLIVIVLRAVTTESLAEKAYDEDTPIEVEIRRLMKEQANATKTEAAGVRLMDEDAAAKRSLLIEQANQMNRRIQ